jgi:phosphate-selective porin OprO/OprP
VLSRLSNLGSSLIASIALAQQPAADELAARLEELEQSHRILERNLELEKESTTEAAKQRAQVSVGDKGFSLKSADGAFALKVRGLLQFDARTFPGDGAQPLTDSLLVRRVRPFVEATVLDFIDVRLMPDFGDGKVLLYDAWADVRVQTWLKLRVGKFKPPLGLERLQPASATAFIERAAPTSLVPNRDLGIQLSGELFGGALNYSAGVFNGVADGTLGDGDNNENKEVAGRLWLQPFRFVDLRLLENFGLGIAGSFGRQNGALPSFKSPGQQTFFSYLGDVVANGNRTRLAPQASVYLGPVGVLAEYTSSAQTVTRGASTDRISSAAWHTSVTWALTPGDKASYEGLVPAHAFNFNEGRLGALELVARYHVLRVDDAAFPTYADGAKSARRATSFGLGLNWYLNRNAKVMLDCERTYFIGGAANDSDRPTETALFGRFQVNF